MKKYTVEAALYGDTTKTNNGTENRLPYEINVDGGHCPLKSILEWLDDRFVTMEELMKAYKQIDNEIFKLENTPYAAEVTVIVLHTFSNDEVDEKQIFDVRNSPYEGSVGPITTQTSSTGRVRVETNIVVDALKIVRDKCIIRYINECRTTDSLVDRLVCGLHQAMHLLLKDEDVLDYGQWEADADYYFIQDMVNRYLEMMKEGKVGE